VLLGGELKNIHKSAANKFLLEEAQWFNVNTEIASKAMKDVYKKYKKYTENSRKQTQFLKDNFSQNKMTEVLKGYMDQIKPVVNNPLQLPKLKKSGGSEAPKLNLPKLPKLQKA
jgi:predicted nucleotide-binding protein (sugar kinase/HSP70/actin superfamily)